MEFSSVTALCTRTQVKDWLNLSGTDEDSRLDRLITAASLAIAEEIGRDIGSASGSEYFDGNGSRVMVMPRWPISAVASVSIDGVSVSASASPQTGGVGYFFDNTRIMLNGWVFTKGIKNILISYTAGHSTLPGNVVQAAILTVAAMRNSQSIDPNAASINVPGAISVSFNNGMAGVVPAAAVALLRPYVRRFSVVQ